MKTRRRLFRRTSHPSRHRPSGRFTSPHIVGEREEKKSRVIRRNCSATRLLCIMNIRAEEWRGWLRESNSPFGPEAWLYRHRGAFNEDLSFWRHAHRRSTYTYTRDIARVCVCVRAPVLFAKRSRACSDLAPFRFRLPFGCFMRNDLRQAMRLCHYCVLARINMK